MKSRVPLKIDIIFLPEKLVVCKIEEVWYIQNSLESDPKNSMVLNKTCAVHAILNQFKRIHSIATYFPLTSLHITFTLQVVTFHEVSSQNLCLFFQPNCMLHP
jgi:hypothetical protein